MRVPPKVCRTTSMLSPTRADRKSTRLNSSHDQISYAVFCLKKKKHSSSHAKYQKPRPLQMRIAVTVVFHCALRKMLTVYFVTSVIHFAFFGRALVRSRTLAR